MASDTRIAAFETPGVVRERLAVHSSVADYWSLTKPDINVLIAIATFAGFYLGSASRPQNIPFVLLIHTLLGTLLVAGGAGTLNQYVERRHDARMRRTRRRPLAAGRLEPFCALCLGALLSFAGSIYLAIAVNTLASLLAVITLASYLSLYTPLKRKTPLCTVVGALPGAMPPLIGYAAATEKLSVDAWILYAILFLWQFPHFMAIAWMYREDYLRAGYLVLPCGPQSGRYMSWQTLAPSLVLIPVSMSPIFIHGFGRGYSVAACALSSALCFYSARLALQKSNGAARRLLMASIVYLPLLFFLVILGRFQYR